jgi:hypothetical protein
MKKISLTDSLHSLPTKPDSTQNEIFQRLKQAEEVRQGNDDLAWFFSCIKRMIFSLDEQNLT